MSPPTPSAATWRTGLPAWASVVGLLLVLAASFLRTAQKEILSTELLGPTFVLASVLVAVAVANGALSAPSWGWIELLMLAYLGWVLLSVLLPHAYEALVPATGNDIDLARRVATGVILPLAVYQLARTVLVDERSVRWLLWTVVGMTVYSAWVSIIQFHGPQWLVWPRFIVEAPSWPGRAVGVFDQPVTSGMLLVVGIVVCLMLAGRPDVTRGRQVALYVITALAAYAVYLTHTRAAVLGLVVAVGLGAVLARGWRRGFVVLGVLGVLGLASQGLPKLLSPDRSAGGFGSPSEIHDRLNLAATALHAVADHPVLGIGFGRFAMYNTYEHVAWSSTIDWSRGQGYIAHQNELGIAAELGLPGVALWLGVLVGIVALVWRAVRVLPSDTLAGRPLAVVAAIALAVMIANGLTVDLRPLEFTTMLPLVLAGGAVAARHRHRLGPGPDLRPKDVQPVAAQRAV